LMDLRNGTISSYTYINYRTENFTSDSFVSSLPGNKALYYSFFGND